MPPPEGLAQDALGPVPLDRSAHAPADGEAETVMAALVGSGGQVEEVSIQADASAQDFCVVRTLGQPFPGSEALRGRGLHVFGFRRRRGGGPSGGAS